MFFLLYSNTDDRVFDDFPKISDHFSKISKDFPKFFRRPDERSWTFSENFPKFPKTMRKKTFRKICRRLSRKIRRYFDHTSTNLSTIEETNLISVKWDTQKWIKTITLKSRYHYSKKRCGTSLVKYLSVVSWTCRISTLNRAVFKVSVMASSCGIIVRSSSTHQAIESGDSFLWVQTRVLKTLLLLFEI